MSETIRTMAVIPLEEYKQLISDNPPTTDQDINDDDTTMDEDDNHSNMTGAGATNNDIPSSLLLILECAPSRTQRQALMILKYMAQLNGRIKYDEDSGEVIIDGKAKRGSNLCEIIRILLSNRPSISQPRSAAGIKSFLKILAESALPANLIKDVHWRKYLKELRSINDTDSEYDNE